MIVKNYKL